MHPVNLVAYDEQRRPYLRAIAAVPLVVVAAAMGALLLWLFHATSASGSPSSDGRLQQAATTPAACVQALDNADAAMRDVRAVEAALTTQLRAMNDLIAHRISTDEALGQTLPPLTRASQQSLQLDQDAAAYAALASVCRATG